MMKKVMAILIVALMLFSCVSCGEKPPVLPPVIDDPIVDPSDPGKDPGKDPGTDPVDPITDPVTPTKTDDPVVDPGHTEIEWTDRDDIVYIVAASAYLRKEPKKDGELINMSARLGESYKRVAVSENWSRIIVNIDGTDTEVYIVNDALTEEDLSTDKFTVYETPETRYVAVASLNVRSYPTLNNNAFYATLVQNDVITVIGYRKDEDMSWYMINLQNADGTFKTNADGTNAVFFVSAQPKYTSDAPVEVQPTEE